jgi:hypothetical protein
LPQELAAAGITTYAAANEYLERVFLPDFNRRFTVTPAQAGSAFVPLVGVDLELLLSVQHERTVWNDSTVSFENVKLQLPPRPARAHYVRCPVLVHEFPEGTLGISYQGRLLARYTRAGQLLPARAAERKTPHTGTTRHLSRAAIVAPGASMSVASKTTGPRGQPAGKRVPRAAARPTRSSPQACEAGCSPTRAGAAVHNVDGHTRNPKPPAPTSRPNNRAVHTVDSSLRQNPARSVRARRAVNQKAKEAKKKKRSRTERTS